MIVYCLKLESCTELLVLVLQRRAGVGDYESVPRHWHCQCHCDCSCNLNLKFNLKFTASASGNLPNFQVNAPSHSGSESGWQCQCQRQPQESGSGCVAATGAGVTAGRRSVADSPDSSLSSASGTATCHWQLLVAGERRPAVTGLWRFRRSRPLGTSASAGAGRGNTVV